MTGIEWRIIPSIPNYEVSSGGDIRHAVTKVIRKKQKHWKGYETFSVRLNGKCQSISVHRSVCEAFHGPCPPGKQAGHKNGIRADNRAKNLGWITPKQNQADRLLHGTAMKGVEHPGAKLKRHQLEDIIFRVGRLKESQSYVGFLFGVAQATISEIMSGKIYGHEWGLRA